MGIFGIFSNFDKDENLVVTKQLMHLLSRRNLPFFLDPKLAQVLDPKKSCLGKKMDIMFVVGGDGTMLSAARAYAEQGVKFVGINLGRVGFLLNTQPCHMEEVLATLLSGEFQVEERLMLAAKIISKNGEESKPSYALNEAVVSEKSVMRIIRVNLFLNGKPMDHLKCDGVIVSTPTGSTGYSLSAGGSIAVPTLDVMLITPICSHSLTSSNMIVSGNDIVEILPGYDYGRAILALDGQQFLEINKGDRVVIQKAPFAAKFITFKENNFFILLKEKLAEWTMKG